MTGKDKVGLGIPGLEEMEDYIAEYTTRPAVPMLPAPSEDKEAEQRHHSTAASQENQGYTGLPRRAQARRTAARRLFHGDGEPHRELTPEAYEKECRHTLCQHHR